MLTVCVAGELMLNIPSFLNVDHDVTTQKATLSITDPEDPHQRAMWGMFYRREKSRFRVGFWITDKQAQ